MAQSYNFSSKHFANDLRLQDCATSPSGEIRLPQTGKHVGKVHEALAAIREALKIGEGPYPAPPDVSDVEVKAQHYGKSTAAAVLAYKTARSIINFSYQQKADDIVGLGTIRFLDEEMAWVESKQAFENEPQRDILIDITGDNQLRGIEIISDGNRAFAKDIEAQPKYVEKHGQLTEINFFGGFGPTDPTQRILKKFDDLRAGMKRLGRIVVMGTSAGGRSVVRVARGISARGVPLALVVRSREIGAGGGSHQ